MDGNSDLDGQLCMLKSVWVIFNQRYNLEIVLSNYQLVLVRNKWEYFRQKQTYENYEKTQNKTIINDNNKSYIILHDLPYYL